MGCVNRSIGCLSVSIVLHIRAAYCDIKVTLIRLTQPDHIVVQRNLLWLHRVPRPIIDKESIRSDGFEILFSVLSEPLTISMASL